MIKWMEPQMKTVTCPPKEEELTSTIPVGTFEGQIMYTYTYKITTKLAGTLPGMFPSNE